MQYWFGAVLTFSHYEPTSTPVTVGQAAKLGVRKNHECGMHPRDWIILRVNGHDVSSKQEAIARVKEAAVFTHNTATLQGLALMASDVSTLIARLLPPLYLDPPKQGGVII